MNVTFVCLWSERSVLESCALATLQVHPGDEVCFITDRQSWSDAAIEAESSPTAHEIVVLLHQDAVFPAGWRAQLDEQITKMTQLDPGWGVAGVSGVAGQWIDPDRFILYYIGTCRDLNKELKNIASPTKALVLDAPIIIKRRGYPRIDPDVPGYIGMLEDLCETVKSEARSVWVLPLYTEHYSSGRQWKPGTFEAAARYLRDKWQKPLMCGMVLHLASHGNDDEDTWHQLACWPCSLTLFARKHEEKCPKCSGKLDSLGVLKTSDDLKLLGSTA